MQRPVEHPGGRLTAQRYVHVVDERDAQIASNLNKRGSMMSANQTGATGHARTVVRGFQRIVLGIAACTMLSTAQARDGNRAFDCFAVNDLTKVFEGPYKDVRKWCNEMKQYAQDKGKPVKKMLNYYTTCPKCAKSYGKNYVVLFAEI